MASATRVNRPGDMLAAAHAPGLTSSPACVQLRFEIRDCDMEELNTPRSAAQMEALQGQLGLTPRGTITNAEVRTVTLQKQAKGDRLGLVFYPVGRPL